MKLAPRDQLMLFLIAGGVFVLVLAFKFWRLFDGLGWF